MIVERVRVLSRLWSNVTSSVKAWSFYEKEAWHTQVHTFTLAHIPTHMLYPTLINFPPFLSIKQTLQFVLVYILSLPR